MTRIAMRYEVPAGALVAFLVWYAVRGGLPQRKGRRHGYVYLLRNDEGLYKIGRTKDPDDRMATFKLSLPFRVKYEHLIECSDAVAGERALHKRFAAKRLRGPNGEHTEWFELTPTDVRAIKRMRACPRGS